MWELPVLLQVQVQSMVVVERRDMRCNNSEIHLLWGEPLQFSCSRVRETLLPFAQEKLFGGR